MRPRPRRSRRAPFALAALTLAARPVHAQPPAAPASQLPPIRPLGAVVASSAEPLGSVAAVRALPGGRVLVNDMARRRVLLFDSTLATYTVVADTTSATGNAYGGRLGGLLAFRGDSSLFVDPQSLSMLVVDPQGKLGRVLSVPRASDAMSLTGLALGAPGFDARGRLVYRAQPGFNFRMTPDGPPQMPAMPDSAPIVRVDLATRQVDTVTFVRTPRPNMTMTQDAEGRPSVSVTTNPLPTVDDWAVLSDGTIAVLRGRDFHVDLVGPDGTVRAAPRMPYDWQRMSDEYKVAFLDSTRTAMERQRAELQATLATGGGTATSPGGDMIISMRRSGDGPPLRGGAGGGAGAALQLPPVSLVPASELPDYKPAFGSGAARADADGNLWVRLIPTRPLAGPLYAVIDGTGKLVDRVLLPANTAIAGFGPGGVVYLGQRDAAAGGGAGTLGGGVRLQRARVR